jgi:D-alanyl-D-alanine carboxypeptidase/D-alanyl-D-alanine-endopeptidase (penicillin-binding protein 4)
VWVRVLRTLAIATPVSLLSSLVFAVAASPHRGRVSDRREAIGWAAATSPAVHGPGGLRRPIDQRQRTSGPRHRAHSAQAGISSFALIAALGHQMTIAGAHSGALVYDITTGQTLYATRASQLHPPASVEKLYTATTALAKMGPAGRLSTTVFGSGQMGPKGVWEGNLYLRGGGDPTFGAGAFIGAHYDGHGAAVSTLVQQLVYRDGIHRVTGRVLGDETYLDSLRGEPSSGYAFDPWLEGDLSALAFDRGAVGSFRGPHAPAAYAAQQLLIELRRSGVKVPRGSGPAPSSTPPTASELAIVQSPPLSTLLGLTLPPSDNFFAETLLKDLGARFGGAGSTAAGAAVVRETIAKIGLDPHVVDGSGLSREDLTSPEQVVDLLRSLQESGVGPVLRGDLAVAGRTGTLSERMRHSWAEGRCQAKTGTLEGVSNLAGYCTAHDGHLIAFALFDDGIPTERAHTIQNAIAEAIASY